MNKNCDHLLLSVFKGNVQRLCLLTIVFICSKGSSKSEENEVERDI